MNWGLPLLSLYLVSTRSPDVTFAPHLHIKKVRPLKLLEENVSFQRSFGALGGSEVLPNTVINDIENLPQSMMRVLMAS